MKLENHIALYEQLRGPVGEVRVDGKLIGINGRIVRKSVTDKTCHGKDVACLPGKNGKCVACFDDD